MAWFSSGGLSADVTYDARMTSVRRALCCGSVCSTSSCVLNVTDASTPWRRSSLARRPITDGVSDALTAITCSGRLISPLTDSSSTRHVVLWKLQITPSIMSNDFCLSLMYHLLPTLSRILSSLICTYLVLLPRANWSTIYHPGIMSQIPSVFICVKTDWGSAAKSPRPYNQSYLLAHILISWNGVFNIAERGPCRSTFPCHDSLVSVC